MFKMQPNTEQEIGLEDNRSVRSGVSNRSRLSKKKEDDLISVISQLSRGSKRAKSSQSNDIRKKDNLGNVGKSVINDDKKENKDELIERLSNISRKVSETNKSFLEKIAKKDDDIQSIRSKHSQILNSSHMKKEKKQEPVKPKEKKVFTLKDMKKYSRQRGGAEDDDNRSVISGMSHRSGLTNMSFHTGVSGQTALTTQSTKEKMK